MKPIQVRHPGLQVLLKKNIGRTTVEGSISVSERFSGQRRTIDLTPYLGEQGGVRVTKSVREPAGGFVITFADRINPDAHDTVYGLVEPMDVVEIRMAGNAYRHPRGDDSAAAHLPIMMRGLVSEVRRVEAMGGDGRPQRSVVISGQDYGKVWQIIQIVNSPFVDPKANLITSLPFFARFGLSMQTLHAEAFVKEVFDKVINPYIERMRTKGGGAESPMQTIATSGIEIADGVVSPFGVGGWQGGTIYSLLTEHCDTGPWNELYIDDMETGPVVVYRPNPYIKANLEDYIVPVQAPSDPVGNGISIARDDVMSMTVARSDADVANYFWVGSPRWALNADDLLRLMSYQAKPDDVYQQGYGNNDPDLYGFRQLQHATQQGGRAEAHNGNGLPDGAARTTAVNAAVAWMNLRRQQLREINKDNVLIESGSARLKGNEKIRAGVYLRLTHGNMESAYYVPSVQHDYLPFQGYFTSVTLERGTGFIDRVKKGGGRASPYWAELGED